MNTKQYLAAVAATTETGSDYAVAKVLGVERQYVSTWQRGTSLPDPLICYAIARAIGVDPAQVVADVELERAERAGAAKRVARWREFLASAPGELAAALAAVVLSVWTVVQPAPALAAPLLERSTLVLCPAVHRSIHCRDWGSSAWTSRALACLRRVCLAAIAALRAIVPPALSASRAC